MARAKVAVFGSGKVPQRWVDIDDVAALLAALAVAGPTEPGGILKDQQQLRWDDSALTHRGVTPTSASEFIETQARAPG